MSCENSSTSSLINVNETTKMSCENISISSSTNNESEATKISSKITSTLSPTDLYPYSGHYKKDDHLNYLEILSNQTFV